MTPEFHREKNKANSLAGTIFKSVLAFTVAVILVVSLVLIGIFYVTNEQAAEDDLAQDTKSVVKSLNSATPSEYEGILMDQFSVDVRYTLIDGDGTVLYDSEADASTMENHADRPEVEAAGTNGAAVTSRYSETLATDYIYAAACLEDGSIIRLSQERQSLISFLGGMVVPLVVALVVAVVLAAVLSRQLTRRIMQPIDALDFSDLLNNEIYEEMQPLLVRIDEQQRQLKQQNEELAEADNMRRDFSSNVSHEMKTPLQVISGYAELMKEGVVAPEDYQRFSQLIYDEAQDMRSLINDVLTLSKLDESAFERDMTTRIDLFLIARAAADKLQSLAEERKITVRVEGEPAEIVGNQTLAEEMLHNLIENGIRYNHEGGWVVVDVRHEDVPRALANTDRGMTPQQAVALRHATSAQALATQRQVVVRVSDNGVGIAEDQQDKIFERFYRVEQSRSKETGGTGLGLAIVKHAVLYHSGTIEVHSALGKGSTFELRFQAPPEDAPQQPAQA